MDVTLEAYDAARTAYTLIDADNGSVPWRLVAYEWGNAVWDQAYSGPRGTLGARPTSSTVQNRAVALGLRLLPANKQALPGHLADLNHVLEMMRRHGGRVAVTTASVTYIQYLEVLSGSATLGNWTNRAELHGRIDYGVTLVCEPYVRGPSMEVVDGFTSDTRTDYTFDSGASSDVSVSGGELAAASGSTAVTMVHTAVGYQYGDCRVAVTSIPGGTITSYKAGVVLKRTGSTTRLEVYVDDTGAASRLRIDKVVSGVRTNLASTNLGARITTGAPFRVVGYITGNLVTAHHYGGFFATAEFAWSPTTSTSATLTSTDVTAFGHDTTGQCGLVWTAQATSARLDNLTVSPYAYLRTTNQAAGSIRLRGDIPGDAPALAEIEVVADPDVAGLAPKAAVIGFAREPAARNYMQDGAFDGLSTSWSAAAVSGVTGAATSVTIANPGRFGPGCLQIVCPATANTGASAAMYGPFYAGVTYTASVWCRAASATTNTRLRLGVSGDIASSSAVALSTTWTQKTVTWTPTATVLVAYIACEVTAATATTWQIDAAQVYEGTTAPSLPSQSDGRGGRPPHALLSAQEAAAGGFTLTAVATWPSVTGAVLRRSGGTSASARWRVDPALVDTSPHTATVEMEVWAWITAPATTWTAATLTAGVYGADVGRETYTREYGAAGVPVTTASSGLVRLGTLAIPTADDAEALVFVNGSWSFISGNFDLAWVLLVPPGRRVLSGASPGLVPDSPPAYVTAAQILPDGLVRARTPYEVGWSNAGGVGQTVTVEPGGCELVYGMQGPATGEPVLTLLRVTPTPRWHHLRDS